MEGARRGGKPGIGGTVAKDTVEASGRGEVAELDPDGYANVCCCDGPGTAPIAIPAIPAASPPPCCLAIN